MIKVSEEVTQLGTLKVHVAASQNASTPTTEWFLLKDFQVLLPLEELVMVADKQRLSVHPL